MLPPVEPIAESLDELASLPDVPGARCRLVLNPASGDRLIERDLPTSWFQSDLATRLDNEIRLLEKIECRHYSRLISHAILGDRLHLTYRHTDGRSLESRLEEGPLRPAEVLRLGCDLLTALIEIHGRGCVHRDWRPSHIVLTPEGDAVLAGYGPVWRANLMAGDSRFGLETVRYASPELAGIIKYDIGPTSDLYSLGLVLYASLAGGPMFDGETVGDVLLQQSTTELDADRLPADTPTQLISMIELLTHKDPRERYQSAQAAFNDARAILDSLEGGQDPSSLVIGRSDFRRELIDPAFVGRTAQLHSLQSSFEAVLGGGWKQVMIACPSGMGKSRLVQELSRIVTRHNALVLHGDSIEEATQEPNACWLQVLQQVARHCQINEPFRDRLREAMEDYREEVLTAMPMLADVFGWQGRGLSGPDEFGQARVVAAFGTLMTRLGSAEKPVMIWLDNCQWLDDQSIRVLREVAQGSATHQLLLLSTRPNEGQSDRVRENARLSKQLHLGPLSHRSVQQLCESMAGQLPEEAIAVVQDYAEGSPFMAAAVLRGMVESSVLVAEPDRWRVDAEKLQHFQMASGAGEILAGRLNNLSTTARTFMNAAAVVGSEFTLDTIVELTEIDLPHAHEILADIRRQRMIWSKPDGSYAFVHDKIRDTVLEQLPAQQKREMHGRIGDYFVRTQPERSYDLAYHFDAAGMHYQALPHALVAAVAARESFSLGSARMQLEIAARAFHVADRSTQHRIESMMSEVLMLQGEYDDAEQWLVAASESATTDTENALVATRRGELAFKRGNKDTAVDYYESALQSLDQSVCRNRVQLFCKLTQEIFVQTAHTACFSWIKKRTLVPDERETLRLRLFSDLAHVYWYTRDKFYTLWAHLRGMNRGECFQPTSMLAQAYSEHAPAMTLLGWYRRGIRYARRSLDIRKNLRDVWGQGQSRNFLSILYLSAARFEPCVRESSQAVSILERTGDYWEVHIARYQLAAALYRKGQLKDALEQARTNYRSAVLRSDFQASGNIVDVWSRAAFGSIPADVLHAELERDVYDPQRLSEVKLAEGVHHFYHNRYSKAADAFAKAIQIAEQASVANTYVSPNYAWLASALRKRFETDPPKTAAARRRMTRELCRAAAKAVRVGKKFNADLPHALREYAAACAMRGLHHRAARYFDKSLALATRQQAELEQIQTTLLRADFAKETGWKVDPESVRQAEEQLHQLRLSVGATNEEGSLSLVDRFDSLLDAGRRIAICTETDVIRNEVLKAASKLLRGDRVLLVKRELGGGIEVTLPDKTAFDPQIVRKAEQAGTAVICEREALPASDSRYARKMTQDSYGTYLCCPVIAQGKIDSFLYVANSYMMGMYGDDEVRIANYLASAAGAAIEKANSFAQLQELNYNLEQKVAERTETLQLKNEEIGRTADRLRAAQDSLRKAKEAAEHASKAKSEFLARMSHEIRTPITAVLGYTELMLRDIVSDPEEQKTHLQTIHSNGSHLLHLLNDILDLSKIEADKIEIEHIPCSPARVISDVIKSLRGKAEQKNIALQLESTSGIPETITSDPTRLRQIITNLIGNAIKFTHQGGVTVRLSTLTDPVTNLPSQLCIAIRDTGIGMSSTQLERIFDPFSQADTSTTRKYGGTGLGLSISQQLAESLGGGLDVESSEGLGSTFTVRIGTDTTVGDKLLSAEEVLRLAKGHQRTEWQRVDLSGIKVLIVDDAETNRNLISRILVDSKAEVEVAENGEVAVNLLRDQDGRFNRHGFDVVLMDMQMPVLDGYMATRSLREHECQTPIIAMTANSMVGDEAKCRDAGCDDYLSKPIDVDGLLQMVRSWSGKGPQRDSEPPAPTDPEQTRVTEPPRVESTDSPTAPLAVAGKATPPTTYLPDDWMREFAVEFVAKVDRSFPMIKQAFESEDLEEVARKVHWIKGTGGSVGLEQLTDLATSCEQAAKQSNTAALHERLDEIESFVKVLVDECGDELADAAYKLTNE